MIKYIQCLLSFLFLFNIVVYSQSIGDQKFNQDMAIVHDEKDGLPKGKVEKINMLKNQPTAITEKGAFAWKGKAWQASHDQARTKYPQNPGTPPNATALSSVRYQQGYAVGCDDGLYFYNKKNEWKRALPADDNYSWALKDVAALAVDSKGRLWFGAREGVGYFDGAKWKLFTGKEGLPYNHFTCAAAGQDGVVWFGTEKGAIRAENDYFYYRASRRWLPDDHVNDIVVDEDGTAWIATDKGIGEIKQEPMTLEEKANYFIRQVEERHNRMGFICNNQLSVQYDMNSWKPAISDNDGMYTAEYGAAMAFRYAVTHDLEAKKLAERSFKACKWLVDITGVPGFPARVIIPVDWPEPVNKEYGHEYNLKRQQTDPFWKDIYPRFPLSKDGHFRWKCDTSSDELAGHYFFYAIYYDLVAETPEEKAAVRQVVAAITDHLIEHGFKLVDYDGKPTRWGNFDPEYFNSIWGWDQRGLNSMMMLSFLNVASHVTGNPKYGKVAGMLREKYHYHINAMHPKEFFPPDNVVPWDNNLCLMSMYGLINYEKDPELLLMYRASLENAWLQISKQKNAFWDGLYGALANHFTQLVDQGVFDSPNIFPENKLFAPQAVKKYYKSSLPEGQILETLQRIPLDLIGYAMENTQRLDVVLDPTPGQKPGVGWRMDGYALPIDERGHVRLDRDGFVLNMSEGNGYAEHEGTFYLLPYYLALYHKLVR